MFALNSKVVQNIAAVHCGVLTAHSTLHSMDYIFGCTKKITTKFLPNLDIGQDQGLVNYLVVIQ